MTNAKFAFAVLSMCLCVQLYAQTDINKTKITAKYDNAKVSDIISDIGSRYNIQFSYNPKITESSSAVKLDVKDLPFSAFMAELCHKASLEYEIINNNVILKKAVPKKISPKQTIRGQVLDGATQQPLEGAIVRLVDSTLGLTDATDSNGFFRIPNVPVGRRTIRVTYLGCVDNIYPDLLVESSKEVVLNIQMKTKSNDLGEVAVYSNNRGEVLNSMASVSATSISVEETKRFAAAAFDPARVALNFAGVASSSDLSNELSIRGNSPTGVLYRMEGIEILNPSHFSALGATGGAISMLSSSTLANCDFYTGAFPAEYGDAISGVMDMRLRDGNNEQREHSIMIGLLGIEASTEGYFSKASGASYIVNYRYSTLGLIGKFIPNLGSSQPDYQDLSFKISVPAKKAGTFSIWGIMGMDQSYQNATNDTSTWATTGSNLGFKARSMSGSYGITHKIILTPKSYLQSMLAFSGQGISESDYMLIPGAGNDLKRFTSGKISIANYFIRLSELYNYKLTAHSDLRTGFTFTNTGFNDNFHTWNSDTSQEINTYASKGWTQMLEAYAEWQEALSNKWSINGGVHYTQLFLNNSFAIDPRFSVQYKISKNHKLGLATGLYSKPDDISTFLYNNASGPASVYLPNKGLKIPQAVHAVLGYTYNFANDFQLKTELYYQYLFHEGISQDSGSGASLINAVNFSDLGNSTSGYVSRGTGMNYGVDVTLQKFFTKGYYFLFTASAFKSTYRTLTNTTYNSTFDRNYLANILGGKEFKVGKRKANVIGLNAKFLMMGGNRYTPLDLMKSKEQQTSVYDEAHANQLQTPVYYRLDMGIRFKFNTKRATHTLMLDVQNVTSRLNVWFESYNTQTNSLQYVYQQGLLPLFNYRVEFKTK